MTLSAKAILRDRHWCRCYQGCSIDVVNDKGERKISNTWTGGRKRERWNWAVRRSINMNDDIGVHGVTRGMEPSVVGCRISAETANIPTLAGHTTISRIHRCIIRANDYYQWLGRQKDITDTYLYFCRILTITYYKIGYA